MKKIKLLSLSILAIATLFSCNNDDDNTTSSIAINTGTSVTVTNTFQSEAMTQGTETTIEDLFQLPEGSLAATNTVSSAVEFPEYLLGLYDIDIQENNITFELVAEAGDETYASFFRTIEAGTTDRYYLTFTEDQNVTGFTSSDPSVTLRMDSSKVLVVEISEGFNFNPGTTFSITLN